MSPARYLSVPLFAKYQQTIPYVSASSVFKSCSRTSTLRTLDFLLGHFLRGPARSSLDVPMTALIGKPPEPLQLMTGSAVRWAGSDASAALGFQVYRLGNLDGNRPSVDAVTEMPGGDGFECVHAQNRVINGHIRESLDQGARIHGASIQGERLVSGSQKMRRRRSPTTTRQATWRERGGRKASEDRHASGRDRGRAGPRLRKL
jgi:hypothetical protein